MRQMITLAMANQERSGFVETNVNKFAISNHTALKLHVHALRTFPRFIVNMSFISYQIETLLLQRNMVKTT